MADNTYFQKYRDSKGEWRWRFRAANHETIGVSSEGYTTERSCDESIEIMRKCYDAPVRSV